MRKMVAILLCLLMLSPFALAEDELFSWTMRLNDNGETEPHVMAPADGGGVFVAGSTTGQGLTTGPDDGNENGFVMRVDGQGNTLWIRRIPGNGAEKFTKVLNTRDGGCLAIGFTTSTDDIFRASRGGKDAFLLRLDADGKLLWSKMLGGSDDDELLDAVEAEEGQILVCGRTKSRNGDLRANYGGWDAWVALLSGEDGKPLWIDRYGDEGDDQYTMILQVNDGWLLMGEYAQALVTGGEGEASFEYKPILMVYGADGSRQLDESVILGETGDNKIHTALETDTGWILLGETNSRSALMPSPFGGMDLWVLHIRQNGRVQWQRRFGSSKDERSYQIICLPDGGYLLLGTTNSFDGQIAGTHGGEDLWLLRVSSAGILQWQQPLGGNDTETPAGLLALPDGGALVAGTSLSQDGDVGLHSSMRTGILSRTLANGNLLWTRQVGGDIECTLLTLEAGADGAYLLGSFRSFQNGAFVVEMFIAKLSDDLYPAGK